MGKEFALRTDHKPNLSVSSGKTKLDDTLTDEIMNYQPFKLKYLPGNKMFVDALSRPPNAKALPRTYNPDIFCTTEDPISTLVKDVQNDTFYGPIYHALSRPDVRHNLSTRQQNAATLFHLRPDSKLATKTGQVVIPKRLRPAILL